MANPFTPPALNLPPVAPAPAAPAAPAGPPKRLLDKLDMEQRGAGQITEEDLKAAGGDTAKAFQIAKNRGEVARIQAQDPTYLKRREAELLADEKARSALQGQTFGVGKDAAVVTQAQFKEPNKMVAATPAGFSGGAAVGAPLEAEPKPVSRASALVKKMTEGAPKTKTPPIETQAALKNGFDSGKIFDLVGGLGASLESAYGNRALADTLYGKKWGAEDAAAQELERLSKAQGFTSAEAEKQRAFEGQQNAAQRQTQLQASGAIQDKDRLGKLAGALVTAWQQGRPLTPEQSKLVSNYYGANANVLGGSLGGGASNDPVGGVRK